MALFMGIHSMGDGMTEDMINQSWESYKTACSNLGCVPQHAHVNAEGGKAFCITEAVSAQLVQQAHDDANVAVNEILAVTDLT